MEIDMMKLKKLFALMSVSTLYAMTSAAVSADIQKSGQGTVAGLDKIAAVSGTASIFTLSAGPIPVTERTLEGERKFMVLEEAYARKLGWIPPQLGDAAKADGQYARARSTSKTLECTGDGGCGSSTTDTD